MIRIIQLRSFVEENIQNHVVRTDDPNNEWVFINDNSLPSHCQASIANVCNASKAALETTQDILVQVIPGEEWVQVMFNASSRVERITISDLPPTAQAALANVQQTIGALIP